MVNCRNFSKELLEELYVSKGLSITKCAEELNSSFGCIRGYLRKYSIPIDSTGNGYSKKISKESIEDYYINQSLPIIECAEKLNCTVTTVREYLKRFNIPIKPYRKNFSKELLEELYVNQKLSIVQIGEQYDSDPTTIWNYLKRFDIPIRPAREANLGRKHSDEFCQKISKRFKGGHLSTKTKILISIGNTGKIHSEENKKKQSEASKKLWQDPEYRTNQSNKRKKKWQDPEYVGKQMKARSAKQNKAEIFLESVLNNLFPNEWKYVGDGEIIIAGKCPDFININGQKKIVELYGDYWHKGQDPQDRIEVFKPYGYETLVIWEKELKNVPLLERKLIEFHIIG